MEDNELLFKDISTSFDSYWDRLTKKKKGFSFDKMKPIVSYIDEEMKRKFGEPDKSTWTRANLRSIEPDIVAKIRSNMCSK